jgi:hypothetical protein
MTTTRPSSSSTDSLSARKYYQYSKSISCSSTKTSKSIKTTLLGIWQGLNNDEFRSSTSLTINPTHFEERRVKKVKPTFLNQQKNVFI